MFAIGVICWSLASRDLTNFGVEFKGKLLICLNRIWLIAHNGAPLMAVSLTSPLLTVVCHRERSDPWSFLISSACLSFRIPRMYADDTYITYAGSDLHLIQSSLSHDLEKLRKWLVSNRLTLNATNTEFMLIGSRQRLSTLSDTLELSMFRLNQFLLWNHLEYMLWKSKAAFPHW